MLYLAVALLPSIVSLTLAQQRPVECPEVPVEECCMQAWSPECPQPQCLESILENCPQRKSLVQQVLQHSPRDLRRAPQKLEEPKCGTAEQNYHPCTSKTVANKLFKSCCELYAPPECHFMCEYETDQAKAKQLLTKMVQSKCSIKHISSILYCASQNRDNRQCCQDLDLNAPQLMIGSRCLRMCDPSGSSLDRITKEDVTCLYNWNVMMYCHHSGIREM
ncbi:Protein R57.2 [Aphelenchoides avenae]|nr:Protein R57.2 [Aphelenchus avenae]